MNTNVPILGQKSKFDVIKEQLAMQVKGSTELKSIMVEASIDTSQSLRKAIAKGAFSFYRDLTQEGFSEERAFKLTQDWFLTLSLPGAATNNEGQAPQNSQ